MLPEDYINRQKYFISFSSIERLEDILGTFIQNT